jgi:shikimate dehydrogenase
MGNPVAHSKSPQIHTLFAHQTGQELVYEAILVDLDSFSQAVATFRDNGGKGLNITVPFKQEAWTSVDEHSPRAKMAGAVNTIIFNDDGRMFGDNTDGTGLVRDITDNYSTPLKDKNILLLGAGGAVRGVLGPILEQQPASLTLANRTVSRAVELADHFDTSGKITPCGFADLADKQFDIVINGTAASLEGEVPPLPDGILAAGAFCYDMMYGNKPTAFVDWSKQHGAAQSVDGLGMLVEQAAESFYLWRGVRPDTGPVIETLRQQITG